MGRNRAAAIIGAALCAWVAAGSGLAGRPAYAETPTQEPGKPALAARTLSDREFDISTMRGSVVVVNLWATWCGPCKAEMPVLDSFYRRHHGEGVEVIGLSLDQPTARAAVAKAAGAVSYPIAMARDAREDGLPTPKSLPVTYVIGSDGKVAARLTPDGGELTEAALEGFLGR